MGAPFRLHLIFLVLKSFMSVLFFPHPQAFKAIIQLTRCCGMAPTEGGSPAGGRVWLTAALMIETPDPDSPNTGP